ncbi:MAG TPA: beta-galactosidase [Clostridiales bacterium]|nr:beta-galactosidase [Clostridiales bacterium]
MSNDCMPRPEYPRPQFVRDRWTNLNGKWGFEKDCGDSGRDRRLFDARQLKDEIVVPFCPESKLSGIGHKDFMPAVWYRKEVDLVKGDQERFILHFGAVDYKTEVWVNGTSVGTHKGGYSSFSFDITDQVLEGKNVITVCAQDQVRSRLQPSGKQSPQYDSFGCHYTRTTGIWQTVWIEPVPDRSVRNIRIVPDIDNGKVHISGRLDGVIRDMQVEVDTAYRGHPTGSCEIPVNGNTFHMSILLSELHLWEPGCGRLYDLDIRLTENGQEVDHIKSYFGMRSVSLSDNAILINNKPVFQRLVLDQGFYPDGIYTAPTDLALEEDIMLSLNAGFNGARLHEKIFEPRFLYHADRLGYIVWEEHANWGLDISNPTGFYAFLPEWLEAMERDFNHPAIIGWCPFNETNKSQDNDIIKNVYRITKMTDPTRPVIDTSGYIHVETDLFDVHNYTQDVERFKASFQPLLTGEYDKVFTNFEDVQKYRGGPYFVSEFGGTWWKEEAENAGTDRKVSWGYGNKPTSLEEFYERYRGLVDTLLDHPKICAFCYTQLTDVEQEMNGIYTYDRKCKFDMELIRSITSRKAAIE